MSKHERLFDWESQHSFAHLSHDRNPIHLDAVFARRTLAGAPIVYGIHSLLWVLDCLAQNDSKSLRIGHLKANFLRPIYVGDTALLELTPLNSSLVRAAVTVSGEEVLNVTVTRSNNQPPAAGVYDSSIPPTAPPDHAQDRDLSRIAGLSGAVSFSHAPPSLEALYPSLMKALGAGFISPLVCSSCLVGMIVPGLNSIYSGLDISFSTDFQAPHNTLYYKVASINPRFRLTRIQIDGAGFRGMVDAQFRMPPVKQASLDAIQSMVGKDEFRNSTSLVIGGSRGLGELTAKLIACGGGHPVITFAHGAADAENVAREIQEASLQCSVLKCDVTEHFFERSSEPHGKITHLYYFATPHIARRKSGSFDRERFQEFNAFYVDGFFRLVQAYLQRRSEKLHVFYPSSIFVEKRPMDMTEYAMSKVAGETLCADMQRSFPQLRILVRRLPRLLTDQTSAVAESQSSNSASVLLPILRELHGATS